MIYIDLYRNRKRIATIEEKRPKEAERIQEWVIQQIRRAELRGYDFAWIGKRPDGTFHYKIDSALLRYSE